MSKRYRLTAKAEMHGTVRDPGYVFTLEEGQLGPHRTVVASDHGAAVGGHYRIGGDSDKHDILTDVPLYEELKEESPQKPIFDLSRDGAKAEDKPNPIEADKTK